MTNPRQTFGRAVLSLVILLPSNVTLWGQQTQSTGLKNPTTLAMDPTTSHAFIIEQDTDKLLRWDGKKTDTLFERLSAEPANIKEITASTFRDGNRLTLVGKSTTSPDAKKSIRLVTLKIDVEDPTQFDIGMSRDFPMEDADSFTAITSTDYAIYLATTSTAGHKIWRIETKKATMGKATQIFKSEAGVISALAISPQGHLVAVIQTLGEEAKASVELQFLHARNGQKLLTVPTDMGNVTSLSYSPKTGLIYGTGSQADRAGVYRFDVFFDGFQQSVRAFELAQIDDVIRFQLSTQNAVALVGGKTDGRAVQIDVK